MVAWSQPSKILLDNVVVDTIRKEIQWWLRIISEENRASLKLKLKLALRKWIRETLLFLWRCVRYTVSLGAPDLIIQVLNRHAKLLFYLIMLALANKVIIAPLRKFLHFILLMVVCGPTETYERIRLKSNMKSAETFEEYTHFGNQLDAIDGRIQWRETAEDNNYNWSRLKQELFDISEFRQKGDLSGLMDFLRTRLVRGGLGITRPELYGVTRIGTKRLIEKYVREISKALSDIVRSETVPMEEKLGFIMEMRHTHGRTGLCLSGGCRFGLYHLGVIKALHERSTSSKALMDELKRCYNVEVLNNPKMYTNFTPRVALSVEDARLLINMKKICLFHREADVRPYEDFTKSEEEKCMVFLGGLPEGIKVSELIAQLKKKGVHVKNKPFLGDGYARNVQVQSEKHANDLIRKRKIFLFGSSVDVRPYVNVHGQKKKPQ